MPPAHCPHFPRHATLRRWRRASEWRRGLCVEGASGLGVEMGSGMRHGRGTCGPGVGVQSDVVCTAPEGPSERCLTTQQLLWGWGGSGGVQHPPPPDPDFIAGKSEMYKRKYGCGLLLVHKLAPQPSTALHSPPQPSTALHSPPQPSTALHSPPQPSTTLHSPPQPSTTLHTLSLWSSSSSSSSPSPRCQIRGLAPCNILALSNERVPRRLFGRDVPSPPPPPPPLPHPRKRLEGRSRLCSFACRSQANGGLLQTAVQPWTMDGP